MAKVVDDDGLTPQEAQACVYRAQGLSQSEAYRRAFDVKRMKRFPKRPSLAQIRGTPDARVGRDQQSVRIHWIEFNSIYEIEIRIVRRRNLIPCRAFIRRDKYSGASYGGGVGRAFYRFEKAFPGTRK